MRRLLLTFTPIALVLAVVLVATQTGGSSSPAEPRDDDTVMIQSGQAGVVPQATGIPQDGNNYSVDADRAADGAAPVPVPESVSATGGTGAGGGVGGGTGSLPSLQVLDRKIIRDATLDVTVDDVPAAVQAVENAVVGVGGFVSSSSLTVETPPQPIVSPDSPAPTPAPERQRATVQVRVPAEAYPGVLKDLRGLGDVKTESSNSQEVTEEYTDLEARLRNLQATEQRYLELLNRAEAIPDILTVQDRLSAVRLEIEQVQGRMKLLDDLTDLATITVNLSLPPVVITPPDTQTEPGWAQDAWDTAWEKSQDVLETLGAAAIVAGVVLVWVLVPAVMLGIAWRIVSIIGRRGGAAS